MNDNDLQCALYESYFLQDKQFFWEYFNSFIIGKTIKYINKKNLFWIKDDLIQEAFVIVGKLMDKYTPFYDDNRIIKIIPYIISNFEINLYAYIQTEYAYMKRLASIEAIYDKTYNDEYSELYSILKQIKEIDSKLIKLHIQGYNQYEIADIVKLSQPQVFHRLKLISEYRPTLEKKYTGYKLLREYLTGC